MRHLLSPGKIRLSSSAPSTVQHVVQGGCQSLGMVQKIKYLRKEQDPKFKTVSGTEDTPMQLLI